MRPYESNTQDGDTKAVRNTASVQMAQGVRGLLLNFKVVFNPQV